MNLTEHPGYMTSIPGANYTDVIFAGRDDATAVLAELKAAGRNAVEGPDVWTVRVYDAPEPVKPRTLTLTEVADILCPRHDAGMNRTYICDGRCVRTDDVLDSLEYVGTDEKRTDLLMARDADGYIIPRRVLDAAARELDIDADNIAANRLHVVRCILDAIEGDY